MKGRWRPANSEHAETEQVVGRDGGRRKKSDERHWGVSARGPAERARVRPPAGSSGLLPEPGVWPHLLAAVVEWVNLDSKRAETEFARDGVRDGVGGKELAGTELAGRSWRDGVGPFRKM
uniref:DUF397 domain-containing protein n=1 Tax=Globodera pallida TaxID=36090 RepID=A0A183C539_GLOPA